jgi:hypothetical protein
VFTRDTPALVSATARSEAVGSSSSTACGLRRTARSPSWRSDSAPSCLSGANAITRRVLPRDNRRDRDVAFAIAPHPRRKGVKQSRERGAPNHRTGATLSPRVRRRAVMIARGPRRLIVWLIVPGAGVSS